jgi:hypothetical protein
LAFIGNGLQYPESNGVFGRSASESRAIFPAAVEAGVTEVLQTWDCKVPNCEGTATKGSGRYAMLYHFDTEEARNKARLSSSNGDAIAPITTGAITEGLDRSTPTNGAKRSHEFRAAGLVALGKQLDEAMAEMEQAPIKLEEAQRRWDAAVAKLSDEICSPNIVY